MKNIKTGLHLLLLLVFLTGCNNKPKIGFLMDTLEIERWNKDKALFIEKVEALGGIPIVEVAEGDPALQVEQAKKLLKKGVARGWRKFSKFSGEHYREIENCIFIVID